MLKNILLLPLVLGIASCGDLHYKKPSEISLRAGDLVVSGVVTLNPGTDKNEIKNINRIYFEKGSVLRTGGADLEINVAEVYSEGNARIETFSETDQAPLGKVGRSGGRLNLNLGKVTGELKIVVRGERGGKGFTGGEGKIGAASAPDPRLLPVTPDGGYYACRREHFVNGGGAATSFCLGLTYEDCRKKLVGLGPRGGQGEIGGAGNPGYQGGDSGDLHLQMDESSKQVSVKVIGGLGGIGGDGGPGGKGGEGGEGANLSFNRSVQCERAPKGEKGAQGLTGPIGHEGTAGNVGRFILNGVLQ